MDTSTNDSSVIEVEVIKETHAAILISIKKDIDDTEESKEWIPLSQVSRIAYEDQERKRAKLTVKNWILAKKGII